MIYTMSQVYKTICEYCLGNVEYKVTDLLKDRFDTVYFLCPSCDSQVEVELPDDKQMEEIPIATEEEQKERFAEDEE